MAIMKQYKQGDLPENLYGNEASKQGDSKINVVKPGAALPGDAYAEDHAYDALRYGCMSRPIHPVAQRGNDFLSSSENQNSTPADSVFGY